MGSHYTELAPPLGVTVVPHGDRQKLMKTPKRPNTEPQGVPETPKRLFRKALKIPEWWRCREELKPTKKGCF